MEKRLRFVVQEHHAKKAGLHWDFRLEDEDNPGMFDSWVIKKLGKVRQRCYLMIAVEPHSEVCAYFEGEYGPGYGEGPVHVWDKGTYLFIDEDEQRNEYKIYLDGEKLNGVYKIKIKPDGNALFIITDEEYDPDEEEDDDD